MLGLAIVVTSLTRLRARACVVLACLASIPCIASLASANVQAQAKTTPANLGELRRAQPSPHVAFDNRVQWQEFQYDWLGNTQRTEDDAHGFYDRSLGGVENGDLDEGPLTLSCTP